MSVTEYTAGQVKAAVTGNGRASKDQVRRSVEAVLRMNLTGQPADVSDAIALAWVAGNRTRGIPRAQVA